MRHGDKEKGEGGEGDNWSGHRIRIKITVCTTEESCLAKS